MVSWYIVAAQLLGYFLAIWFANLLLKTQHGVLVVTPILLTYLVASRLWISRSHRRGVRLVRNQEYSSAVEAFKESYAFFEKNGWIDRYRAVTLLSPSAICYREMALCNIAFSFGQLGDGDSAEHYYRRALQEFPASGLAAAGLRLMESARQRVPHLVTPTDERATETQPFSSS